MLSIEKKTTKQTNSWEEKGKTLTVEWQTSIKKFYSAATQISITETLQTNKQTKPKKTFEHHFIKMMFLISWLIPWETHLKEI